MSSEENLILIGAFEDSFQANMAKEILHSNEITCRVVGDAFQMFELTPSPKISLQINSKDLDKASELLEIYFKAQ